MMMMMKMKMKQLLWCGFYDDRMNITHSSFHYSALIVILRLPSKAIHPTLLQTLLSSYLEHGRVKIGLSWNKLAFPQTAHYNLMQLPLEYNMNFSFAAVDVVWTRLKNYMDKIWCSLI